MSTENVAELRPSAWVGLPIDPTVEERIQEIQTSAFRAAACIEMVRQYLLANNDERVGDVPVSTLADALELGARELSDITSALDLVNLRRASKSAA